jgi:signal transduction histidine kinase
MFSETSRRGPPSTCSAEPDANTSVLLVDDYLPGLYVKSRVLAQAGFRVLEATTGKQALVVVSQDRPPLVVLDVKLPDMDGIAVCRAIKENPETASTMVLQTSAYYVSTEDQVLGLDSGADGYIPGDVAPALLVAAVRALLRTRRAEETVRASEERLQLAEALHKSDQKLRALAASLFTAQDDERRRVAREVHDNLSQRVALLEIELTKLRHDTTRLESRLDPIIRQTSALSEELRNLSHRMHPSGLEHLGLEPALRSLCVEVEQTQSVATHFKCVINQAPIPQPIIIAFYRITQEALRNVAKHAGDARATVTLFHDSGELCVTIQDDGCGFDLAAPGDGKGIGLISMQERIRLVSGRLDLVSGPGQGTTVRPGLPWCRETSGLICAWVPMVARGEPDSVSVKNGRIPL